MADAHEAFREHVQQEPSQELMDLQAHEPLLVFIGRIAPAEGDLIVGKLHEPVIGDSDSVRVLKKCSMKRSPCRTGCHFRLMLMVAWRCLSISV